MAKKLNVGGDAIIAGSLTVASCTGCGGSTLTATAQDADFTAGFATYQKDANNWKKNTNVPSAEITLTGAATGDVCIVSTHTTGTTNFAPIVGKDEGTATLSCYVSAANKVVVILSIGNKDVAKDGDTEYDGDEELGTALPVNIAVISTG